MLSKNEFQKRYDKLHRLLFGFAMKLTRNRDNAKDLVQETAYRAYNYREKFTQGTNFKAWITTIMRNTFINTCRKKRTRNKVEAPIEDFLFHLENKSISGSAESSMMVTELRKIIRKLSAVYRIPFLMLVKGYRYKEIAKYLDIPMGTVKSRIHFARISLRKMVKSAYGKAIAG